MKKLNVVIALGVVAASAFACSDDQVIGGDWIRVPGNVEPLRDAGVGGSRSDAGADAGAVAVADAGLAADASAVRDAGGVADAGRDADSGAVADAGAVVDAGGDADAGAVVDAGLRLCTPVVIADTTFLDADWLSAVRWTQNGATATVAQEPTGGNLDAFRRMTHDLPTSSAISLTHTYVHESYNPQTQGAIMWIDYSEDRKVISPPWTGAAVGALFLLTQGGRSYLLSLEPNNAFTNTTWSTMSRFHIKASDFRAISQAEPDFSAAGSPINFGVLRSNSNISTTYEFPVMHGLDNWVVTVNRDCR